MSHSWDSPVRLARDALIETLESRLDDEALRKEVIALAVEEFDNQLAEPDEEMIQAGLAIINTVAFDVPYPVTAYRRRRVVEAVWRAMTERAFDR